MQTIKKKKCRNCKDLFTPFKSTTVVCSLECSLELTKANSKKKAKKEWRAEKKKRKEALKTNSDYVKELQVIFNKFIRLRDKDKGCISCNKPLNNKFDAGHFYSTGSYPELRFNEDNVHGQCVHCNQHKHGNLLEYNIKIVDRIGEDKLSVLNDLRNKPKKYTIDELKGLKVYYNLKIKNLK